MGDRLLTHGEVYLTTATSQTLDRSYATIASAAACSNARLVTLAARPFPLPERAELLRVTDVTPFVPVEELFDEIDAVAFALPFAIERLVEAGQPVVFLRSGSVMLRRPNALLDRLADRSLVLTSPIVATRSDSDVPELAAREAIDVVSPEVFAVSSAALDILREWQEAIRATLYDADLRLPAATTPGLLASFAGRASVDLEGEGTVVRWWDPAGVDADSSPGAVADTVELWELATERQVRIAGEMTDLEYRLVDLRVHDQKPLEPIIELMRTAGTQIDSELDGDSADTLFARQVRRASDPNGLRWGGGDVAAFGDWLWETAPAGTSRLLDLCWYASDELRSAYPEARRDRAILDKHRAEVVAAMGFDPFEREAPASRPATVDQERVLAHAVRWRWNVARGLVPGVAARAASRRYRPVPPPRRGNRLSAPQAVPVERVPRLWGASPRSLNLLGCFRAESGLGQAARASLVAVRALGIPFRHVDTSDMYPSRNRVPVELSRSEVGTTGDVNLIHANALEMLELNDRVFRHRLGGRFNAAMWFWEPGNLPRWQVDALDRIDELWVASSYLQGVFGQYGKVPVKVVGLASPLPAPRQVDRSRLGIDEDEFVFLFVYDALSAHGRKNPELALEAFSKAFGPHYDGVRFILKASNLNKLPADRDRLQETAARIPAITIIDRYLDQEEVFDLMATADAYVSLHAAEGYGLTLLESMSLGTPVICTGYSGNMDFTDAANSWLVDYSLMRTATKTGPYPAGSLWSRPDVDHAAELMRAAFGDRRAVTDKGARAAERAHQAAAPETYARRLGAELGRVL